METLECMNAHEGDCDGAVEYRMPLSGTGRSFPRCEAHWEARLEVQRGIDERYPVHAPSGWSHWDAGEYWGEDDY
jgi:hypothetical protein